jgi:hypothetical protein
MGIVNRKVQGEQGGVNTVNKRRLTMWSNQKMKSAVFIHNDDVKCFHMAIQGSHKLVLMGHINFEDHALIKRWWVGKKMIATSETFKDKKNEVTVESNLCLLLEDMHIFKVLEFTTT